MPRIECRVPRERRAGALLLAVLLCFTPRWSLGESPALAEARRALAEGIPQLAVYKLTAALAAPGFPSNERTATLQLLAEAQLAAKLPNDALATLSRFTDATDTTATLLRAHAYAAAGRWREALPVYQSLSDAKTAAALGEAESLQSLGRTGDAIVALERVVSASRGGTAARLRLASLLVEQERSADAREILAETPGGSAAEVLWRRYIEARALLVEKKPQDALETLEPIVRPKDGRRAEGLTANLHAAATLAFAEATLTPENPEQPARILETFIRENPESPHLELVFRRLDQLYALDSSPAEQVLHTFVKELPPRGRALAQFYVCRMQLRGAAYDRLKKSIGLFLKSFPAHPLTPQIHEMEAALAIAAATPATKVPALKAAALAYDAASLAATTPELKAEYALRTALVNLQQGEYLLAANHLLTAKESPRLRQNAMFNAALAWLMQTNHEMFAKELAVFAAEFGAPLLVGQLRLEQGLVRARSGDTEAGPTLKTFLAEFPEHPRRTEARLAAAELAFQAARLDEADALLRDTATDPGSTPATAEQTAYLAIFLEDKKNKREVEEVISLARDFIAKYPQSPLLTEVRMKLGEVCYHAGDFLKAQEQFELLAREQPDGPYAETALFLAGQCGRKLISPENLAHARDLFGKVVERKGRLEPFARLHQANIQHDLGADEDAVKLFDTVLNSPTLTEPEVRHAALIGKGVTLTALAQNAPADASDVTKATLLGDALASYDALLALESLSPTWRNQALYLKGKTLVQLDRGLEALDAFNQVLNKTVMDNPRETFWFAKAGADAAGLLEGKRDWRGAVSIYRKMAAIPGPHAKLARERVKTIQLEQFLWD
jgi:outer membrane protein assembly factor BamD (BamD/ComL family)